MAKVFIDGAAGTTGLKIVQRLSAREDIELLALPDELRKDAEARKAAMNAADVVFLCLPDAAAREAAAMVENPATVVIDASTAHRVNDEWTYGFPELAGQRSRIARAKRIANPGCHASGFIALVAPLTQAGLLPASAQLSAFSLTGYSGGGKAMIAEYEASDRDALLDSCRTYGLSQAHKHLPEMAKVCGLDTPPVFVPVVEPIFSGMQVTVPLFGVQLGATKAQVEAVFADYYREGLVRVVAEGETGGLLFSGALAGRDDMRVCVCGNDERMTLVATFDNLGKGASGAAIQNMNIALGLDEALGLNVG